VIALQADGSGLYTCQALWTMARERLDVTVIVLNNASYAILNIELMRSACAMPDPRRSRCSVSPIRFPTGAVLLAALAWQRAGPRRFVPARRWPGHCRAKPLLIEAML
jgi:hypothetical protein